MNRLLYSIGHSLSRVVLTALVKPRYLDIPDVSGLGGAVIASNHQSFLDPVLIGMALPVPIHYMARASLFDVPLLGRVLAGVGVHPVRRGQADVAALRTAIGVLRAGHVLVLFPEGTRTSDGELGRFKPGVGALALRCHVPVLPACVEGAFECWPRTAALPRPGRAAVAFGDVVWPGRQSAQELTDTVLERIAVLQQRLRGILGRPTYGVVKQAGASAPRAARSP